MEINTIRVIIEVLAFVMFVAIVAWAWSGRNRSRFEEAARLPFEGDVVAKAPSPDHKGKRP